MKRPFMVWIGFISICCSKVAVGCWYYQELLKTLKVAQKLRAQSIYAYPQPARPSAPQENQCSFSHFLASLVAEED